MVFDCFSAVQQRDCSVVPYAPLVLTRNTLLCTTQHTMQWGILQGLEEDKDISNANPANVLNPGNFKTIKLIPDGAAKFTRAMGMTCE